MTRPLAILVFYRVKFRKENCFNTCDDVPIKHRERLTLTALLEG